jgi:hypothetical protein
MSLSQLSSMELATWAHLEPYMLIKIPRYSYMMGGETYANEQLYQKEAILFKLCNKRLSLFPSLIEDIIVDYIQSPGEAPFERKETRVVSIPLMAWKDKNKHNQKRQRRLVKNFYQHPVRKTFKIKR